MSKLTYTHMQQPVLVVDRNSTNIIPVYRTGTINIDVAFVTCCYNRYSTGTYTGRNYLLGPAWALHFLDFQKKNSFSILNKYGYVNRVLTDTHNSLQNVHVEHLLEKSNILLCNSDLHCVNICFLLYIFWICLSSFSSFCIHNWISFWKHILIII